MNAIVCSVLGGIKKSTPDHVREATVAGGIAGVAAVVLEVVGIVGVINFCARRTLVVEHVPALHALHFINWHQHHLSDSVRTH